MKLAHLRCRIFGHCWSLYSMRKRGLRGGGEGRTCLRCFKEEVAD